MAGRIDTLLLLGLPACGKSMIRRFLDALPPQALATDFPVGMPLAQLDDFPYVHLMWRLAQVMADLGEEPAFFEPGFESFRDPGVFGALIHLLNEDYAALQGEPPESAHALGAPGAWIVDRLESAHLRAGLPAPFSGIGPGTRAALADAISAEAASLATAWSARRRPPGSTIVIELARGGPHGSRLPLRPPHGYAHALRLMSPELLCSASVLYVRVTPEESRRRNRHRARPGEQGSSLHHGVPEKVMRSTYGVDDLEWLIDHSERAGTITVRAHGSVTHLPAACFDNQQPRSTLRCEDPSEWPAAEMEQTRAELRAAFASLVPGGG